jgi:type III restriction enzyme
LVNPSRNTHNPTSPVVFDNTKLVDACAEALRTAPPIPHATVNWRTGQLAVERSGVATRQRGKGGSRTVRLDEPWRELPDLLSALQERTQLTRRSLYDIILQSERLSDFKVNPQKFIEVASKIINLCKSRIVVDGIKYQRIGDEQYYAQELYESTELVGYLRSMATDLSKSATDAIVFDSEVERRFVEDLEANEAVKVYTKLPASFTIPTPLGSYNPDWAVLAEVDGTERLYFVIETKGSAFLADLRDTERGKIACGQAHFEALSKEGGTVEYRVASTVADVFS